MCITGVNAAIVFAMGQWVGACLPWVSGLGLVGRTLADEIDKIKAALPDVSFSQLLQLLKSQVFLPWVSVLGLVVRTLADEIDKIKAAFPEASSSDILVLMKGPTFLPWLARLGDRTLQDEISTIKEALPEASFVDILDLMILKGFLPHLHKHNMHHLVEEVRSVYGVDISTLQVLHVMCRRYPRFFPNKLLCHGVAGDIRGMTRKNCSRCKKLSGARNVTECDTCRRTNEDALPDKNKGGLSKDDSEQRINRFPHQSLKMIDGKLRCQACSCAVDHFGLDGLPAHLKTRNHPVNLTKWLSRGGEGVSTPMAAGST